VDLSAFVGRAAELERIRSLLQGTRLLTLTGAGGSGKTRLALETVTGGRAGHDVAWVELSSLEDPALLPQHVAESAGFPDEVPTARALAQLLHGHPRLLVLDNCEHLVDACADLATSLLQACPDLKILATSREALGVRGERAWLVPPLALPDPEAGEDGIRASEAVRLFVDRARDVAPDFTLGPGNAPTVAAICHALDGIPLAIELAAARVRVLSVGQILERLGASLDLLAAGSRTTLPRHRTLRAALDWSYDLLDDDRRILLHRMSVFRGGATLDAVESICAEGEDARIGMLDALASLVDRSLVVVREQNGEARYRLLETVRQYAVERLGVSGGEDDIRRRHAAYFSSLAAEAEPHLTLPSRPGWLARLLAELDNLREALAWTRHRAPADHVVLVGRLWWFWFSTRHWAEGGRWISEALGLPEAAEPGHPRAALLFARGALLGLQAHTTEPRALLEEAVHLAEASGDQRLAAYARNYLGMTWAGEGRNEALEPCRQAEAWFRENGDLYGLRLALLLQGSAAMGAGRLDDAKRLNREGVEVARRFGLDRELSIALQNLAAVHLRCGEFAEARRLVREALSACSRDPSHYFMAIGIAFLAEATGHLGDPLGAARLFGCADALGDSMGITFFRQDRDRWEEAIPRFRQAAGAAAFDAARAEGRLLSWDQVIQEVMAGADTRPEAGAAPADGTPAGSPAPPIAEAPETPPGVALSVSLLGGFRAAVEGEQVPTERWSYAKPRELLALMALHPEGVSRDQGARFLWPDAAPSRLKNSFHVTLHHLRKALQRPGWVVQEGDRYRIARDVRAAVDARDFEAAAGRALSHARRWEDEGGHSSSSSATAEVLRAALALYGGDLLEGETAGVWAEEWRDRLRRRAVDLGLTLGRILEETGQHEAAAEAYGQAVSRDALAEEGHRGLMRCWAATGGRGRAVAHYGSVVALLREALDVEPDPETEALARSLRG
jgi:non-specific serine/threonine protein kinase